MSDQETEVSEKPRVSLWKRVFIGLGVLVLVLIALAVMQRAVQKVRENDHLKKVMADLDESDPNWRLEELEAARPTIPDDRNSALQMLRAHRLIPKGAPSSKVMERFDELPPPPELLDGERVAILEKELTSVASALAEARKLADMPEGRHRVVHAHNPIATLLPHAQETREVVRLLHFDALRFAQKKEQAREALRSAQAVLNAGRSFGDEPFMISQLVRIACVSIAAGSIERTLALGEPPLEDLKRLQDLVAKEEAHPTLVVALRGERGMLHALLSRVADGSIPASGLLDMPGGGQEGVETRLKMWLMNTKGMARREHPRVLEMMSRAIDIARLPAHEQAEAEREWSSESRKAATGSFIARSVLPALDKFGEATRRKTAAMRCLMVLLAVERYRQLNGKWPAALSELTPKLLSSIPLDPYDGKQIRYRRRPDSVVVYSIGKDGKDDGGAVDRVPAALPNDEGYRLWDVKHRRQAAKPPAPKPAIMFPPGGPGPGGKP